MTLIIGEIGNLQVVDPQIFDEIPMIKLFVT